MEQQSEPPYETAALTEAELFSKGINDTLPLKCALKAIPFIGSILETYTSAPYSRWKEKRINDFLLHLDSRMIGYEREVVRLREKYPEEVLDFMILSIESAAKTRSARKKQQFAEILINQSIEQKEWDEVETAIKLADQLTDLHFEVLVAVSNAPETKDVQGKTVRLSVVRPKQESRIKTECQILGNLFPHVTPAALKCILCDLHSTGLISDEGAGMWDAETLHFFAPNETTSWFLSWVSTSID
jgi:hypothetical protein